MTLRAWRIVKAKHASTAFTGDGAKQFGGRWNSVGVPMIYVSGSISLAMLEIQVHVELPELLEKYALIEVGFAKGLMKPLDLSTLPRTWDQTPPPVLLQQVGDVWAASGDSAVLRVPSAIVPTEFNYLLSPAHPDFPKVSIGPIHAFRFDARLARWR